MKTLSSRPAFTFVEIVIVMLLVSIFSAGFAISYSNNQKKVTFDSDVQKVLTVIQKARNLSLTNLMINSKQADYYALMIVKGSSSGYVLAGVDIDGGSTEIESYNFSSGITSDAAFTVYYYPPYGEVTIDAGGPTFTMSDSSEHSSTITISEFGGFADVD